MRSRLHEFRRELSEPIAAPNSGMLLHASEVYDSDGRRLGAFDIDKSLVAFNGDIPIGVYEANGEVRSFEQGLPLDQQGNFVIYDGQGTLLASFGEASELNHGDANLVRARDRWGLAFSTRGEGNLTYGAGVSRSLRCQHDDNAWAEGDGRPFDDANAGTGSQPEVTFWE